MFWLGSILGLLIGLVVGAALYKQFRSDKNKIHTLENELNKLQDQHDGYQQLVHSHFNTSANLLHKLTANYREVYQHLATSAEKLCPEDISSQLSLTQESQDLLKDPIDPNQASLFEQNGDFTPPKDYATKSNPEQKGNLSEDFGLEKVQPEQAH